MNNVLIEIFKYGRMDGQMDERKQEWTKLMADTRLNGQMAVREDALRHSDGLTRSLYIVMCCVTALHTDPPPACVDKKSDCDRYGGDMCTKFGPWAHDNCMKFCGFCGQYTHAR